jgi:hypothetical protein
VNQVHGPWIQVSLGPPRTHGHGWLRTSPELEMEAVSGPRVHRGVAIEGEEGLGMLTRDKSGWCGFRPTMEEMRRRCIELGGSVFFRQ